MKFTTAAAFVVVLLAMCASAHGAGRELLAAKKLPHSAISRYKITFTMRNVKICPWLSRVNKAKLPGVPPLLPLADTIIAQYKTSLGLSKLPTRQGPICTKPKNGGPVSVSIVFQFSPSLSASDRVLVDTGSDALLKPVLTKYNLYINSVTSQVNNPIPAPTVAPAPTSAPTPTPSPAYGSTR